MGRRNYAAPGTVSALSFCSYPAFWDHAALPEISQGTPIGFPSTEAPRIPSNSNISTRILPLSHPRRRWHEISRDAFSSPGMATRASLPCTPVKWPRALQAANGSNHPILLLYDTKSGPLRRPPRRQDHRRVLPTGSAFFFLATRCSRKTKTAQEGGRAGRRHFSSGKKNTTIFHAAKPC